MMLAQVNQFGVAPEQVGIWLGCALGIVAGVVERMQPLAERAFAEALKRGG